MKVVSPATTSVRRFVPRSENLKKAPKIHSPLPNYRRAMCTSNIAIIRLQGGRRLQVSDYRHQQEGHGTHATLIYRRLKPET